MTADVDPIVPSRCYVAGCRAEIPLPSIFCAAHWRRLPCEWRELIAERWLPVGDAPLLTFVRLVMGAANTIALRSGLPLRFPQTGGCRFCAYGWAAAGGPLAAEHKYLRGGVWIRCPGSGQLTA